MTLNLSTYSCVYAPLFIFARESQPHRIESIASAILNFLKHGDEKTYLVAKKFLFYCGFHFIAKLVFAAIGGTLLELPLALKDV
jgi:hypothetical protein